MSKANWLSLVQSEMKLHKDHFGNLEHCTLSMGDMMTDFDCGYGEVEGKPFTLWTETRVYFPTCYDGAERVRSVPRNPCSEEIEHIGGGC